MTWLTVTNDHELIEVGNRRWCVTCHLFQHNKGDGFPPLPDVCPRDTPYARWLERKKRGEEVSD